MKKIISSSITLFVLLTIIWSISSWYFGTRAENTLKKVLLANSALSGNSLFRAELLDYRRTWMGANAKLRISSDNSFLSERLGEFDTEVVLVNGPVFIDKSGISLGSSCWTLKIDENSLNEDQLQSLQGFFPEALPTGVARFDFKQKAQYYSKFQSFLGEFLLTGVFDLVSEDNRGAIKMDQFALGAAPNQIKAKTIDLSYQHQKALTASYKPGTASMHVPALIITHDSLNEAVKLNITANSDISFENRRLKGFVKVDIDNESNQAIPINQAQISLQFKGLSSDGFMQLTEVKAELDNLWQQTQWILEEQGEVPEGQDQIWQLRDEINKSSKQLSEMSIQRDFNEGKTQVSFEAKTRNNLDSSVLSGEVKPVDSWVFSGNLRSLFKAQAMVKLDEDLFQFISKHFGISKKQFRLIFKQNKLLMQ